jgi:hypothetical protein
MESYDFCMNLWKSNFAQNLYELMKFGKFVMLALLVAYWATFDIAWPKHHYINGVGNFTKEQEIQDFKALINVFKFEHSF